ncbi:MAG: ArsR family transcriptional regulator [Prevotella sp.]|nr:ArsR family transcriptional regulator [Prevotella sp.]
MVRKIVLDRGGAKQIAGAIGCTREMVSRALNYKVDTSLARKIRYVAKEQYGGVEVG